MGKTPKVRARRAAHEPEGIVSTSQLVRENQAAIANVRQVAIPPSLAAAPILKNLESVDEETRENCCDAIANLLLEGEEPLRLLRTAGVSMRLAQRLADTSINVRVAAAGALTNLAIVGGDDICNEMARTDVAGFAAAAIQQGLEGLRAGAPSDSSSAAASSSASASADDSMEGPSSGGGKVVVPPPYAELIEQTFQFVSHMCEGSEEATEILHRSGFIALAFTTLSMYAAAPDAALRAAQFLNVFSDENEVCATEVAANAAYGTLLIELVSNASVDPLTRCCCASIGFNLRRPDTSSAILRAIIPTLLQAIETEVVGPMCALASQFKIVHEESQDTRKTVHNESSAAKKAVTQWRHVAAAQQLALEVLTNIISSSDPADDYEDMSDEDESGASGSAAAVAPEAETPASTAQAEEGIVSEEIASFITSTGLLTKVAERCSILSTAMSSAEVAAVAVAADSCPPVMTALMLSDTIFLRCMALLGNMVLGLPVQLMGDVNALWNLHCTLLADIMRRAQPSKEEKAETLSSTLWGLLRKLNQAKQHEVPVVAAGHVELLVALSRHGPSVESKINGVGAFGALGTRPHDLAQNASLGNVLIACLGDSSLAVVAEALNAIFDIYADTPYDANIRSLGMIEKLQLCLAGLPIKIREQKSRMDKNTLSRVQEAKLNLTRFIKYKRETMRG